MNQKSNNKLPHLKMIEQFEELYDAMATLAADYEDLHDETMALFSSYNKGNPKEDELREKWSALITHYREVRAKNAGLGILLKKSAKKLSGFSLTFSKPHRKPRLFLIEGGKSSQSRWLSN
jgi:flagellar biosynthesis/type III secretory pathway chaperone